MDPSYTLRLGDTMPDLVARSTQGELPFLSWQSSSWLLLWVYPAAFTPIAVTEFQALAKQAAVFEKLETKIIGLSPDSIHAQMVWLRELEQRFSAPIKFPLACDPSLAICKRLGMIHEQANGEAPVRGTVILDPKRTVRFVAYYPLANGRSVDEVARVLAALRHADEKQRPTPADWKPGDPDLAPPLRHAEELGGAGEPGEGQDFYFRQS